MWGVRSEVRHKWADWLRNPCHLGSRKHFTEGDNIKSGLQLGHNPRRLAVPKDSKKQTKSEVGYISPTALGGPQCFIAANEIRSGPQVGGLDI